MDDVDCDWAGEVMIVVVVVVGGAVVVDVVAVVVVGGAVVEVLVLEVKVEVELEVDVEVLLPCVCAMRAEITKCMYILYSCIYRNLPSKRPPSSKRPLPLLHEVRFSILTYYDSLVSAPYHFCTPAS